MKKVSLFIAAALFAVSAGFVSCSSDDEVDPAVISFDNVTNDQVILDQGKSSYTVNATITSIENLKSVKVTKKVGTVSSQVGTTITSFPSKTSYHLTQEITGITEDCEVTVTVDNGTESGRTLKIKYTAAPVATPLVDDAAFTLKYSGTSQADGLNINVAHGIKFSSIKTDAVTGVFIVEPSGGNNFVMLTNQAAYDAITTKEGLASAYTSGTGTSSFEVKSDAQFSAKFFISKVGNDYFLIKMTNLTFSPGNNVASFTGKK